VANATRHRATIRGNATSREEHAMSESTAESIRQRMREVRCEIGEDVEEFVESARTITDWRFYVQKYPWICLGAAFALGYVVVPKRVRMINLDADAVLELAKRKELVIKPEKKQREKPSWRSNLASLAASAAMRGAMWYLGQRDSGASSASSTNDGRQRSSAT